jgi:PTS system nitrogen regulatory IIA component
MNLTSILSPELTFSNVEGDDKLHLLETVAALIAGKVPNLTATRIYDGLLAREQLGSTGLGDGIAIPHCRVPIGDNTIGCLVKLTAPVDFDAIDNKPVDLLFFLLVPEGKQAGHLATLSMLAEHFSKPAFCKRLRAAENGTELYTAATTP